MTTTTTARGQSAVTGYDPLTSPHAKQLRRLVVVAIAVVMPLLLALWITGQRIFGWDVIFTARAANVCAMVMLGTVLVTPLLLRRYPKAARWRGFVLVWFVLSPFFNVVWQLPLLLLRPVFLRAEINEQNLPSFISWWGYGSTDSNYMDVSRFMIASELAWLVGMALGVFGLFVLLRRDVRLGYLLLGVAGTMQAYNASFYILNNAIVQQNHNVAGDSWMAPFLYFGFGAMWPAAGLAASVICLRLILADLRARP